MYVHDSHASKHIPWHGLRSKKVANRACPRLVCMSDFRHWNVCFLARKRLWLLTTLDRIRV